MLCVARSARDSPLTAAAPRRYLIFVAFTAFFGWVTFNKVPETKGKTIAQLTKEFDKY